MTFDEIPIRMMQLGVDRAWLAQQCDYKLGTLAAILAPNGNLSHKTDKALRRIWEALDREEERRKKPSITDEKCAIVIRAAVEEFEHWNKVSMGKGQTIEQWAMEQLNLAANSLLEVPDDAFRTPVQLSMRTGTDETAYVSGRKNVVELPLIRAAAGPPILSDAEMVEVDGNPGTGRFVLELRGDSMEPQFQDRQRVILRDKSTLKRPLLKYGELYAFVIDGLVTFKQWAKNKKTGEKVLRSLNPEYPDIPADENTDWIGWFDAADNA